MADHQEEKCLIDTAEASQDVVQTHVVHSPYVAEAWRNWSNQSTTQSWPVTAEYEIQAASIQQNLPEEIQPEPTLSAHPMEFELHSSTSSSVHANQVYREEPAAVHFPKERRFHMHSGDGEPQLGSSVMLMEAGPSVPYIPSSVVEGPEARVIERTVNPLAMGQAPHTQNYGSVGATHMRPTPQRQSIEAAAGSGAAAQIPLPQTPLEHLMRLAGSMQAPPTQESGQMRNTFATQTNPISQRGPMSGAATAQIPSTSLGFAHDPFSSIQAFSSQQNIPYSFSADTQYCAMGPAGAGMLASSQPENFTGIDYVTKSLSELPNTQQSHFAYIIQNKTTAERREFLASLLLFLKSRGKPFPRSLIFKDALLDIYALYTAVVKFGGITSVLENKGTTRRIARQIGLPEHSDFVQYYRLNLFEFECSNNNFSNIQRLGNAIRSYTIDIMLEDMEQGYDSREVIGQEVDIVTASDLEALRNRH